MRRLTLLVPRCGRIGGNGLRAPVALPRLSLTWRRSALPTARAMPRLGHTVSNCWTLAFTPKIVVMPGRSEVHHRTTRIEQLRAAPGSRTKHAIFPGPGRNQRIREVLAFEHEATRHHHTASTFQVRTVRREGAAGASREARRRLAPPQEDGALQFPLLDAPQGGSSYFLERPVRRNLSIVSAVLRSPAARAYQPEPPAIRATLPAPPVAGRTRASPLSARPAAAPSRARTAPAAPTFDRPVRSAIERLHRLQPQPGARHWLPKPQARLQSRFTPELVWRKPTPQQAGAEAVFDQPPVHLATFASPAQVANGPSPRSAAQSPTPLPEMGPLVDEVLRRLDRLGRDERLRRGI